MAIIVILCGAPHLYKKDMNNSGLLKYNNQTFDWEEYIRQIILQRVASRWNCDRYSCMEWAHEGGKKSFKT